MKIVGFITISITWLADIASWFYIGNGFTIDFIFLIFAMIITGVFSWFLVSIKRKSEQENFSQTIMDLTNQETKLEDEDSDEEIILIKEPVNNYEKSNISWRNSIPLTCNSCGELISSKNQNCSACNSKIPVCVICLSPLNISDEIVKTSCCQQYAHKEHIINWLNIKNTCPNCILELNKEDLILVHFEL
ncbi:MAG: RING-H2 finger protein [Candidatus Heimdallarchaeota archaeon]|nr:RING-H2 finger protein [Candidatus Heimdallarchaeota archaeon]